MSLEYACLTTERANLTTASPTSHYFTTLGVERSDNEAVHQNGRHFYGKRMHAIGGCKSM